MFQVRVNLRDFLVGDRGARNHRHQADALPDNRGELRLGQRVRHERRPLPAAGVGAVARGAGARVGPLARILLLRRRDRGERVQEQRRRDRRSRLPRYFHAIRNASCPCREMPALDGCPKRAVVAALVALSCVT